MRNFIKEATSGPSSAQKHLRDLAHSPSTNPTRKGAIEQLQDVEVGGVGEEGGLLEFQDVVDYGNGWVSLNVCSIHVYLKKVPMLASEKKFKHAVGLAVQHYCATIDLLSVMYNTLYWMWLACVPLKAWAVWYRVDSVVHGICVEGRGLKSFTKRKYFYTYLNLHYSGEDGAVVREDQTPPPEYHYNEELLSRPLYEPGRRSRLITLWPFFKGN